MEKIPIERPLIKHEETQDDTPDLRTSIGDLLEDEECDDAVKDRDNYRSTPDDIPHTFQELALENIQIVLIEEKVGLENGQTQKRMREFYLTSKGHYYPVSFPPIAPAGYEEFRRRFIINRVDLALNKDWAKRMTVYKNLCQKAESDLEKEKKQRKKEKLKKMTIDEQAKFLNDEVWLKLIIEQFSLWEKAYLSRETAFIMVNSELHPADIPHPLLINVPAYQNLLRGVVSERLRRVQLFMQTIIGPRTSNKNS